MRLSAIRDLKDLGDDTKVIMSTITSVNKNCK